MSDEQRKQLVKMCDSVNIPVDKNKLEADFDAVGRQLRAFIKLRSIHPENLPQYKVQKVWMDSDCMTIVTDTCHYVRVSAEPGYGGCVDFGASDCLDIEDAHNMGIVAQWQYDEYKTAQQAYLERRRKTDARSRLMRLVREAGADTVKRYLDEL